MGSDLGDHHCQVCVLSETVDVEERGPVATRAEALRLRIHGDNPRRMVLGYRAHSPWVNRHCSE